MQRDSFDQLYWQMMYSGSSWSAWGGQALVTSVVVASLFLILIYKPERIRSATLFRWAATFVGLSILLPSLSSFLLSVYITAETNVGQSPASSMTLVSLGQASGPVLLGCGVLAAFAALRPRDERYEARPADPAKHPLD